MPRETLEGRTATLALNGGGAVREQPVSVISVALDEADINAAVEALRSGMLAQGKRVAEFEERFAAMTGARHAIACANGTCALQLAYEPLFEPGDEVLVPAWGYVATASMIVARGAVPVFCEACPVTYNINLADAARRITDRTTAIAATHLYGNPVDIGAVEGLAIEHGLHVIYDAAQAHLATYNGSGLGAFGDAVTYSFYPTKNMTTGEGGMVTTNDDELAKKIRMLRSHGESQKYVHDIVGYNYRMTDVEGAIGASQLTRLPALTERRRDNARTLDTMIAGIDGLHAPTVTGGAVHAYHLYAVRMDADVFSCTRDMLCAALKAEGILTAVHYPRPLTRQPLFAANASEMPVSDRLAETLFCIPIHPNLTEQDLQSIGEALGKVADAYRR